MMSASLVLPAFLFVYASWINYQQILRVTDERIYRTLDVLHEHALKVFQTIDLVMTNVDEATRGLSDEEIISQEQRVYLQLKRLDNDLPQIQAVWIIDRAGHPLVTSSLFPSPKKLDLSDRPYFIAQVERDIGIYVSELLKSRVGSQGGTFFYLSRRRASPDGSFSGVTAVSVRPDAFRDFYVRIGRSDGSYYSVLLTDGRFLVRFPSTEQGQTRLDMKSAVVVKAIAINPEIGIFNAVSQIDGIERRIGYRRLAGYPLYVMTGIESPAIRYEWYEIMRSHLIFGLPATAMMFGIIGLALWRTKRLYREAERREVAEGALRQAQRLEAIGQMTGGVAHDFNNLLMIVNGSVERLRRDLTNEKQTRLLDMIATATQRGESLTRQLLTFSRRQTLTPQVIDLSRMLPETKELLMRSLRGDIEIKAEVPQEVCATRIDRGELELAILNLAVNAQDAMPKGGTLSLQVKPVTLKGGAAAEGLRGEFIALSVTDAGGGVPADVLPHVFEPFFTTKAIGKGTGLGLSQVYGFAKQSGGTAEIASVIGQGTTITLYLPRSHKSPQITSVETKVTPTTDGTGKILLVEDNPNVAEVTTAYLQQLGYQVNNVASARAALAVLQTESKIDLVISDIVMPGGMSGLDLADAIREKFPGLPVVLTTGYSASAQDAVREGIDVLQKPYDIAALRKIIRNALSGGRRPAS
jgi:two-component system NtrC family sensor kinase